jgi:regulatory protein
MVTAIEAHSKKPHMYRIHLKLELERDLEQELGQELGQELAAMDWTAEVDALIAGAQTSPEADEAIITVHEDTLVSRRLLSGRQLTAAEYEMLKSDEQLEDAYKASLFMLERKARTTVELSRALKRKGYAPEVVEGCLGRLKAGRMLDDSAYAKRFTEQRAVGQRKGRMLIRQELLQRGVGREDVEEAIGELDTDMEQESAKQLARKRWPNIKGNDRERMQKLMAVLLRRGFPSGVVRTAVQQVAAESMAEELDDGYEDIDSYDSDYS